jgi:hypothetical protein
MNTTSMPGFSAEASFYRNNGHYYVGEMLAGLRPRGKGIIHPALPAFGSRCFNTMRGKLCCAWGLGVGSCCNSAGSCESFRI